MLGFLMAEFCLFLGCGFASLAVSPSNRNTMMKDRDLSWLDFNGRVLQEAQDGRNPLAERLKFLAIFSANLEEFYKVRIAGQRFSQQFQGDKKNKFGYRPSFILQSALSKVHEQQEAFGQVFFGEIMPGLAKEGVFLLDEQQVSESDLAILADMFAQQILPASRLVALSRIDHTTLRDQQVYLYILTVEGHFLMELPYKSIGRFQVISVEGEENRIIQLDDIYRLFVGKMLPDHTVEGMYAVKVSRDAELYTDEEVDGTLFEKIKNSLRKRETGLPSRLLFDQDISFRALNQLRDKIGMDMSGLVPGGKYHGFADYFGFPVPEEKEQLFFRPHPLVPHPLLEQDADWFATLKKQEVLLTFPHQDYGYVVQLLEKAAGDDRVCAISITLYRVAKDSAICQALEKAAVAGKKVTVFAEVQARFDEESNLYWGDRLEKAGAQVLYSMEGLKVHAKVCLIERIENDKTHLYSYLGTGNFNEKSSKIYTDFGLLTAEWPIGQEIQGIFTFLRQKSDKPKGKKLWIAPRSLRKQIVKQLDKEMEAAKQGKEARATLKLNSLEDPKMIEHLKHAGEQGVKLRLIVRGICCLVAESDKQKENIEIISILGRYLEHSRVYCFHNQGKEKIWLASADLMTRNLDKRIEVAFPITDERHKLFLLDYLAAQWDDHTKARWITPEGNNDYREGDGEEAQEALFGLLGKHLTY